jgi:hypothetical protein
MTTVIPIPIKVLRDEIEAGLPNLRGTNLQATLPVSQTFVNAMLPFVWDLLTVNIQKGNELRLMLFGFPTPLDATIAGIDSSLTLRIRLSLTAKLVLKAGIWSGKIKLPPSGLLQGDLLLFHLGQVPELAAWQSLWPYLRLTTNSSPGVLTIFATLKVN